MVSLHGLIEYLVSDIHNIKESLTRIQKYILDKSIKSDQANDIKDLEDIGKVTWEFISTIYKAQWDGLFMDDNKITFRNKVKSKFNPQVIRPLVNNKEKEMAKPTFISLLPLPIPAKSKKEVNEILKYFKKNNKSPQKKFYMQASSQSKLNKPNSLSSIAIDTLKIKEIFLNLPNKIDLVQKVINSDNGKLKPHIRIIIKSSLYKQVIIPMSNELTKKFLKDLSMHIININHALRNILSNTIADFIYVEDKGVVITTNNVSSQSDLQEIKKYIKNYLTTNAEQVSSPRLPQSKSYLKIVGILYISERSNT